MGSGSLPFRGTRFAVSWAAVHSPQPYLPFLLCSASKANCTRAKSINAFVRGYLPPVMVEPITSAAFGCTQSPAPFLLH
eukprot:6368118-Amphidinium_carterae.1